MSNSSSDSGFLFGILVGGVLGGLAGLLFAPKKGDELQEDVKVFLDSIPERVEDEMAPDSQTRQVIDKARFGIEERVERYNAKREAKRQMDAKQRESEALSSDYAS
jgi:gas vesicle protein